MKRQVPVGLLYRWMYPTVNPYSGGVGVCSLGVLGQLAFFSNQHYSLSSQIPCSVLRAFIHEGFNDSSEPASKRSAWSPVNWPRRLTSVSSVEPRWCLVPLIQNKEPDGRAPSLNGVPTVRVASPPPSGLS